MFPEPAWARLTIFFSEMRHFYTRNLEDMKLLLVRCQLVLTRTNTIVHAFLSKTGTNILPVGAPEVC